ncbi:MAG: hypothetical protein PHV34_20225 [Verrucomicrobiae bacterium]|nr:hypothetical protein [Verrucomicrobiae bacterium]
MPLNQVWRDGWTHRRAGFWPDEPEKSLIRNRCPELRMERVPDGTGRELGYETNTPLADLGKSFYKLKCRPFRVDRDETFRRLAIAAESFGDLLPAKIVTQNTYTAGLGLAANAVRLIGMDNFYLAMVDQPEEVHRFFDFVSTEAADFLDWLEAERLVTPNHGEFCAGSGSCGFTDELPVRSIREGEPVGVKDCWGWQEAQESVGISAEMYAEFIHPYQRRTSDRYGLIYYGCCEPVHQQWPILQQFKNLRKISVSPWCNQEVIAAAVEKNVVLSRKPHPLKLCGEKFDAKEFKTHVQETLEIAQNNYVELIFRDTCTLCGTMKDRVAEVCGIVRRLIGRD